MIRSSASFILKQLRKECKMVHIKFEYKDALSKGEWRKQECTVSSLHECKRIYGLGIDCEYRIISVEEIKES